MKYSNVTKSASPRYTARFHHPDDISSSTDEELQQAAGALYDDMKSRSIPLGSNQAAPFEVELAYIQREQEHRRVRKVAHRDWVSNQRVEFVDERGLEEYAGNRMEPWLLQRLESL